MKGSRKKARGDESNREKKSARTAPNKEGRPRQRNITSDHEKFWRGGRRHKGGDQTGNAFINRRIIHAETSRGKGGKLKVHEPAQRQGKGAACCHLSTISRNENRGDN